MPDSKVKADGRDFSDCTFRSMMTDLPPGIERMITRALESFGTDANVLPRWSQPVAVKTADGKEGTLPENQFFPHLAGGYKDICCADGVAFCLYQTGVVDLGRELDLFKGRTIDIRTKEPAKQGWALTAIHYAHYYDTHDENTDIVYELPRIGPEIEYDKIPIDFYRDWLPGDYFLYYQPGDNEADHINIYLGPFREVVTQTVKGKQVETPVGEVWSMLNSSIGLDDGNEFVKPTTFERQLKYWNRGGRWIRRFRVKAVERLFRNRIGPPVVLKDPKIPGLDPVVIDPKPPEETPQAEIPWDLARASGAPYPFGRSLTWHEGIHLLGEPGLKNADVESFAPGEIVLARFGKKTRSGDSSMVLVRHRFVPSQMRLLDPPEPPAQDDADAGASKHLYSLYMHLAPLETYIDRSRTVMPGIPLLCESDGVPKGKLAAPAWLRRLWPKREPDPLKTVKHDAEVELLVVAREGGKTKLKSIGKVPKLKIGGMYPWDELPKVEGSPTHRYIPFRGPTNEDLWQTEIPPATVASEKPLTYYNPLTARSFDLPVRAVKVEPGTALLHTEHEGRSKLRPITKDGAPITGDLGTLIGIKGAHDGPGIILDELKNQFDDKTMSRAAYEIEQAKQAGATEDALASLEDELEKKAGAQDPLRILSIKPTAKKLFLYTTTAGKEKSRSFPDAYRVDLGAVTSDRSFDMLRDQTGLPNKRDRAFLKLTPGVWMSADEIKAAEERLADRDTFLAIRKRLKERRSCLVGVNTAPGSGWEYRNGCVYAATLPKPPADASGTPPAKPAATPPAVPPVVQIYRKISLSKRGRQLEEPHPSEFDRGQDLKIEIARPPEEMAIFPVLPPQPGSNNALFEVVFATDQEGNNQAEIDKVRAENKDRKKNADELLAGKALDLSDGGRFSHSQRKVLRDRIGTLGEIPVPVDPQRSKAGLRYAKGLHFELFSAENVVDPAVPVAVEDLTPIPNSKWVAYKDVGDAALFEPAFLAKFVRLLEKKGDLEGVDFSKLKAALSGADPVLKVDEWLDFCAKNQRTLARFITVHKPEWSTQWAADESCYIDDQKTLVDDTRELRSWTEHVKLPAEAFFYHPLRFIEWLNTGADISISGVSGAKVWVQPAGETAETELTHRNGVFRLRTFVGEGPATTVSACRVRLENVATAVTKFQIQLKRAEVRKIRLVQPEVEVGDEYPRKSVEKQYFVPVALEWTTGNGCLLADASRNLADAGCNEATIVFLVKYNVSIPSEVEIRIEKGSEFAISDVAPRAGAQIATRSGDSQKVKLTLREDAKRLPAPEDSIIDRGRIYSLVVTVTTQTKKVPVDEELVAAFAGGDLVGKVEKRVPLKTRNISSGDKGEDVAKLQLYLSQIFATDHLPCYRYAVKVLGVSAGEYAPDPVTLAAQLRTAVIDGSYGPSLARALWRFAYRFASTADSDKASWRVATTKQNASAGPTLTAAELVAARDFIGPRVKDDPYLSRVDASGGVVADYPVVDRRFIEEIIKQFRPPYILLDIDLIFQQTSIPAVPGAELRDDWNDRPGRTAVLPIAKDSVKFRVAWAESPHDLSWTERFQTWWNDESNDLDIVLELPAKSAYTFVEGDHSKHSVEWKLRRLLKQTEIELYAKEGVASPADADNRLVIRTQDEYPRVLARLDLAGSRDLLNDDQADAARDAAWVQFWLSRVPDKENPGTSVYKNIGNYGTPKKPNNKMTIDGVWNRKCRESLRLFQKQYKPDPKEFPDPTTTELQMLLVWLRQTSNAFAEGRMTVDGPVTTP